MNSDCDGVAGPDGRAIKIPCACPPDRNQFIQVSIALLDFVVPSEARCPAQTATVSTSRRARAILFSISPRNAHANPHPQLLNQNVAAGFVINNPSVGISFPEDGSKASQLARLNAATVTLQNIHGPGVGCPQAATTFGAQLKAIQAEPDTPAPAPSAPAAPAPAPPANNAAAAGGVDPALVPDFGVAPGTSPDGTGNCKGLNNINIPCSCPPSRDEFIASLNANVAAGHAVNNPAVLTPFPTGSSKGDQQARIATLLSTLQNLHGPGVGCPAVSTVYGQLQQQINALPN